MFLLMYLAAYVLLDHDQIRILSRIRKASLYYYDDDDYNFNDFLFITLTIRKASLYYYYDDDCNFNEFLFITFLSLLVEYLILLLI